MIEGETGSGKEIAANLLHQWGKRSAHAFVALNCGGFPEALIESELFGHEAGAFTGAVKKRIGLIESANHGTFFLDEIESMPLSAQVRLLRVLENRMIQPVGSNRPVQVDFRVVAATKVELAKVAAEGNFRDDLYYRLNVVTLRIPPLRERREDIPLLLAFYLEKAAERFSRDIPDIPGDVYGMIENYEWPGNVRELVHLAERLVLGIGNLVPANHADTVDFIEGATLAEQMDAHEAMLLRAALRRHHGSVQQTIEALGLPRKTFYDKLARHNIRRRDYAHTNDIQV